MPLEAAFQQLWVDTEELRGAVETLRLTAREDRPADGDVLPVQAAGDLADDLVGRCQELFASAAEGSKAATAADLLLARRALVTCQRTADELGHMILTDLLTSGLLDDLRGLARRRGRDWPAWLASLDQALGQSVEPLSRVQRSCLTAWEDLVERTRACEGAPGQKGSDHADHG